MAGKRCVNLATRECPRDDTGVGLYGRSRGVSPGGGRLVEVIVERATGASYAEVPHLGYVCRRG